MNRRAYIYGEISHHTEPIVGWVRLSPASDSWKSFSRAINGVYGTVQDEGLEISRDEVKAIFIPTYHSRCEKVGRATRNRPQRRSS